jgi:hypothetical protein
MPIGGSAGQRQRSSSLGSVGANAYLGKKQPAAGPLLFGIGDQTSRDRNRTVCYNFNSDIVTVYEHGSYSMNSGEYVGSLQDPCKVLLFTQFRWNKLGLSSMKYVTAFVTQPNNRIVGN